MMKLKYLLILPAAVCLTLILYGNMPADRDAVLSGIIPVMSGNKGEKSQEDQSPGHQLYTKHCLACHQDDGRGVRGMFPPLAGNKKVTGESKDVVKIVLFGLQGPITVNERDYDQVMPSQIYLTDNEIAEILTYIRSSWGNKASPVKAEEVASVRKQGK